MLEYLNELSKTGLMIEAIIKSGVTIYRTNAGDSELDNSFKESEFKKIVQEFAIQSGERLDPLQPFASGENKEYEMRWVAMIEPIVVEPEIIFRRQQLNSEKEFAGYEACRELIRKCFYNQNHLVICGKSGSGKTTLLKKILKDFFMNERVVILDSYAEWSNIPKKWTLLKESRGFIDGRGVLRMRDLFSFALRLSASRFVMGELKIDEIPIFNLLRHVGHGSVLATMHGTSHQDIQSRLVSLENTHCLYLRDNFECEFRP
jgi:type IV secretory pathway ATPase VirB11/archaellum biosynthesis ATPase